MTIAYTFLFGSMAILMALVMWYSWLICTVARDIYNIEDKE